MRKLAVSLLVLFPLYLYAQTTHVITFSIPGYEIEKSLRLAELFIGNSCATEADTLRWRNPKNLYESVFNFSEDIMSVEQKELKSKLLGFFYNPKIVRYENKVFALNTKKKIYKKNRIPLVYMNIVRQCYDNANDSIMKWRKEDKLDEKGLVEEFQLAQRIFGREIVE
jgi:hypothetical protein